MNNEHSGNTPLVSDYRLWSCFDLARFSIYRLRELELAQYGLTVQQSVILHLLINRSGSTTAKKIKDITMRQQHSISSLVNRMIKMKLVSKKRETDKKKLKIVITRHGSELVNRIPLSSVEMVLSSLKPEEKKQLLIYSTLLLEKARDLLGISYNPPFLQLLNIEDLKTTAEKRDQDDPSDYKTWTYLNRARDSIYRLRELELAQFGLTVEQSAILQLLNNRKRSLTSREFEDATLRQHHSISTLINRMIKMDLVTKQKALNGKKFEIGITGYAEELIKKIPHQSIDMVFSSLKPEDKRQLFDYSTLLLQKARDLLGVSYTPPFLNNNSQD